MRRWLAVPLALALAACTADPQERPAAKPVPTAPVPAASAPTAPTPTAPTGTLPGDRLPEFTAKVRRAGAEEAFDLAARKGTTVLVVMSTTCPYCAEAADPLKRVESTFQSRGVEFVYLYPMSGETPEEKAAWHAAKGFQAGLVVDAGAVVSKLLRADKTPTAYVVDGKGTLIYRGAVIEAAEGGGPVAHRLADALDEHLAGKKISVPSAEPAG